MTLQQNKALNYLLTATGNLALKATLVEAFTNGRSISRKDLTEQEADLLIKHLQTLVPKKADPADKMRKKIIHQAREMGWEKNGKADMDRLDAWCLRYGFGKIKLNQYSLKQLPTLVSQFDKVYKSYLSSL